VTQLQYTTFAYFAQCKITNFTGAKPDELHFSITFRVQNTLKLTCRHLQDEIFFPRVIPPDPAEKGKGMGMGRVGRGKEFVLCPMKKKRKIGRLCCAVTAG
jgi:hypothetical protein